MKMDGILTTNMIMVAIIVALIGKLIKQLVFKKSPEKARKILLPVILIVIGIGAMCLIEYLNKGSSYGTAVLQGLFSSVFAQFIYDKYHDWRV